MAVGRPLTPRALQGLKEYQYKAGGYTILDDIHQPVWNYLVELFPMWLAPNIITLLSTLSIVVAYALNTVYNADFAGEAASWVTAATAVAVVLYVNLDCLDGKQARRTRTSSPLGQLFDHGCDGLALHMILGNIAASLGIGCGWKMAAGCLGIMVPWMLAQWEEYHTGIMMYGNRHYGVLEANYSICLTHVLTSVFGVGFWRTTFTLPQQLLMLVPAPVAPSAAVTVTVADLALVAVSAAGLCQGASNIGRVLLVRSKLPQNERGHKQLGRMWAAVHLIGLMTSMLLGAASFAAATATPVETSHGGMSAAAHCRVAFSTFGVLYAITALRLIVAHMAKEPWLPSVVALVCPVLALLHQYAPAEFQQQLLQYAGTDSNVTAQMVTVTLHGVALLTYVWYTWGVISQICEYLGIRCFTITAKPDAKKQ